MLQNLLTELQANIFTYLAVRDLKNLATCNSEYYHLLKEYMWKTVKISCKSLTNDDICNERKLENLQHTRFLYFSDCSWYQKWEVDETKKEEVLMRYDKIIAHCDLYVFHAFSMNEHFLNPLCNLVNLTELNLNYSSVDDSGLERICGSLLKLKSLSVCRSFISDSGLVHLRSLVFLEKLVLEWCKITDAGLTHLTVLNTLTNLNIAACKISDAGLNFVNDMVQLERLDLNFCRISDVGLSYLSRLTSLKKLDLRRTNIGDSGIFHVSRTMVRLEALDVSNSDVTDQGLLYLTNLLNIKDLQLDKCKISDMGISHIISLKGLETLSLNHTRKISNRTQPCEGFTFLSSSTSLKELELYDCMLTDDIVYCISNCRFLQYLEIGDNPITDKALVNLTKLQHLTGLELADCQNITDEGAAVIATFTSLTLLTLSGTKVTNIGISYLPNLRKLKRLKVRLTSVDDEGLGHICDIASLVHVDVSGNYKCTYTGLKGLIMLMFLKTITWEDKTYDYDGFCLLLEDEIFRLIRNN